MIGIKCTLDDFKDALEALNDKLKNHHIFLIVYTTRFYPQKA